MVEIWRGLLGFEKIGRNDNFFELGGDSLTAIKMRGRIKEVFNIDIPLVKIYQHPTIRSLVRNRIIKDDESINDHQPQQEKSEEFEEDLHGLLQKFEGI